MKNGSIVIVNFIHIIHLNGCTTTLIEEYTGILFSKEDVFLY